MSPDSLICLTSLQIDPDTMHKDKLEILQNYLFDASISTAQAILWAKNTLDDVNNSQDTVQTACFHSAAANRKLADTTISPPSPIFTIHNYNIFTELWSPADFYRCILFLSIINSNHSQVALLNSYFRFGDEEERASLIKALALLDDSETFKPIALESGRTNSMHLFSALALNNPFPAIIYDDHEYNQIVMKCLFMGLPVSKICGIDDRCNKELSRMCEDYIDERLSANRSLPTDIWLALAPHISQNGLKYLSEYLESATIEHRYFSALAVSKNQELIEELSDILAQRLELETNPKILELLTLTLNG